MAPKSFAAPAAWGAFALHYRSQIAYFSHYRVVLRKGELLLGSPEGATEPLVKRGRGSGSGGPITQSNWCGSLIS